jgi:hypothetical protein
VYVQSRKELKVDIANKFATYLQEQSDADDGITEDTLVDYLDQNYRGQILSHKFTTGHGEWEAILVFKDKSVVKIISKEGQFDVYTGVYNPMKGH